MRSGENGREPACFVGQEMNRLQRISCHTFIERDGCAWFSNWFYNAFFKVELETGKATFLGSFQNKKGFEKNIHKESFEKDKKLYFCPWNGRHVHIYNLDDASLVSIAINKDPGYFFLVEEVVLGEDYAYFIPGKIELPVRKLDLKSLKVTEIQERFEIQGEYLSERAKRFPASEQIKKYHIERADRFCWGQTHTGEWIGFLPMGRQLLRYTEENDRLVSIPLTIINEADLEQYLEKVRMDLLRESTISEGDFSLDGFLHGIEGGKTRDKNRETDVKNVGRDIWKSIRKICV